MIEIDELKYDGAENFFFFLTKFTKKAVNYN